MTLAGLKREWPGAVDLGGRVGALLPALRKKLRAPTARDLRLASGFVLFAYLTTHLTNHAIGLISLDAAEKGLVMSADYWSSQTGTILLYSAFSLHFLLAFWSLYQRRTLRLPPLELLRIALGLWLPVVLMGHFTATRLEFELLGSDPTYSRIVAELWNTHSEWRQLGLLAPGWLHGCLGFYYAFGHRPLWRKFQYPLFAFALLLPVLSALGFVMLARDIDRLSGVMGPEIVVTVTPETLAKKETMHRWLDALLWGYAGLIGATLVARGMRPVLDRSRRRLLTISYPDRSVQVPRGWSVLEASRAFHIAHASSCGGRARCSTCRVRVTGGLEFCPPPRGDELATLRRISADPDVRLACQLRPSGNVTLAPLVLSERPVYRARAPAFESDREAVLLFCDFSNREMLERDHLAHDVLFAFKRYAESACHAICSAGGVICHVEQDSIFALFGLSGDLRRACRSALAASRHIDRSLRELNARLGQEWGCRAEIVVSVHCGPVVLANLGQTTELLMAAGEAMAVASEIRKAAIARGKPYAISEAVFAAAKLDPPADRALQQISACGEEISLPIYFMDTVQIAAQDETMRDKLQQAATTVLERLRG
jgi:adenylate cyclase